MSREPMDDLDKLITALGILFGFSFGVWLLGVVVLTWLAYR